MLDSFGFSGHNFWQWGPVSSFLIQQKPKNDPKPTVWQLGEHRFQTVRGAREAAEEQIALTVLEREKRILASTPKSYIRMPITFLYVEFPPKLSIL